MAKSEFAQRNPEASMRMAPLIALLAAAMATAALPQLPPANAQTLPPAQAAPVQRISLTEEHRHIIKEIIIKEMRVAPPSAEVPTAVGEVIPAGVPVQPVPVEVSAKIPALKTHSFLVKDGAVLIIDPKDNRIAARVD
jgi:hypothetical protein